MCSDVYLKDDNSWEKRSTMQLKLANVALCDIDEISIVVGSSTFRHVCETFKKSNKIPQIGVVYQY